MRFVGSVVLDIVNNMSANNYILLKKTTQGNYTLNERDADTHDLIFALGIFADIKEAIKVASKYMSKEEVEYGLDIQL